MFKVPSFLERLEYVGMAGRTVALASCSYRKEKSMSVRKCCTGVTMTAGGSAEIPFNRT
jgi:hypothetical protein